MPLYLVPPASASPPESAQASGGPRGGWGRRRPPRPAGVHRLQVGEAAGPLRQGQPRIRCGEEMGARKGHIAVAVMGLLLCVVVTAASVQDRDAARPLLWRLAA